MRKLFRRLIRILFNRNTLFVLMLLFQIVILALIVMFLSQHYLPIYLLLIALDMVLVVYISNTSENPSYKLPWLVAMLVAPIFAGLAYLLVKTDAGHRRIKREYARRIQETRSSMPQDPAVMDALRQHFEDGEIMFEAMKREIKAAKRYILLEFFIISPGKMWDELLELLKEKHAQGIEIRLLYDGFGTQFLMPRAYFAGLAQFGIECRVFNSFKPFLSSSQNNRDHRKILVIDGQTAFTGGINIADEYINQKLRFGHWKDGGMLCRGEAAWSFAVMFLQMW